jgi:antitoxin ParD1/3/4/toxin ParE1/3/4
LLGHTRPDIVGGDVRFWLVHSYLVAYRAGTRPLQIARVISGYRDAEALIRPS